MQKKVISSTSEINSSNLQAWLQAFKPIQQYLMELKSVYEGTDDIDKGTQRCDEGRPDNKVHSDLASMIVKNSTYYFIGKPVKYKFKSSDMENQLKQYMFDSNEEQENKTLGKCLSKYGKAYELVAIDEEKDPYFVMLEPLQTFEVVTDDVRHKTICVVTYLEYTDTVTNRQIIKGWIYDKDFIYSFEGESKEQQFTLNKEINPFKPLMPVVIAKNNDEEKGDYEDVLELLNSYNRLLSNSFDDIEGILNAVFVLYNATIPTEEAQKLNKTRVLSLIGENTKAEFLSKKLDTETIKLLRQWIREDIFTITNVPDFTDEKFAGNQSGVAMSYKLIGFENLRQEKAGYFRSALLDRIEILLNYKNLSNVAKWLDEDEVEIEFYPNLPANLSKDEIIAKLLTMGAISRETAFDKMDIVEDTNQELERFANEQPSIEDLDAEVRIKETARTKQ